METMIVLEHLVGDYLAELSLCIEKDTSHNKERLKRLGIEARRMMVSLEKKIDSTYIPKF